MNKLVCIIFLIITFLSCSNNSDEQINNPELLGTWELQETMSDPGDGSGVFVPRDSDKTVEFKSNGTVITNLTFCNMFSSDKNGATGNFSQETLYITPEDCEFDNYKIYVEIKNTYLYLYYPCIEGCGEKYKKIN